MKHLLLYEICSDIAYPVINLYKRITSRHILIGRNARVNINAKFEGFNKIERNSIFKGEIGILSYIGANCLVVGHIGRFCSISGNVTFLTATHPFRDFISTHPAFYSLKRQSGITLVNRQKFVEHPTKEGQKYSINVGNDVYIGYGVTIIGPVSIGDGAIIGACSVVTSDIPEYSIAVGNPAKVIRKRFTPETIAKIKKSEWWNKDINWLKENSDIFTSEQKFLEFINKEENHE